MLRGTGGSLALQVPKTARSYTGKGYSCMPSKRLRQARCSVKEAAATQGSVKQAVHTICKIPDFASRSPCARCLPPRANMVQETAYALAAKHVQVLARQLLIQRGIAVLLLQGGLHRCKHILCDIQLHKHTKQGSLPPKNKTQNTGPCRKRLSPSIGTIGVDRDRAGIFSRTTLCYTGSGYHRKELAHRERFTQPCFLLNNTMRTLEAAIMEGKRKREKHYRGRFMQTSSTL